MRPVDSQNSIVLVTLVARIRVAALENKLSALGVHLRGGGQTSRVAWWAAFRSQRAETRIFAQQQCYSIAQPLCPCQLNIDAVISTVNIICGSYTAASKKKLWGVAEVLHVLSQEANLACWRC